MNSRYRIGIDVGSKTLKAVFISPQNQLLFHYYNNHQGDVESQLQHLLSRLKIQIPKIYPNIYPNIYNEIPHDTLRQGASEDRLPLSLHALRQCAPEIFATPSPPTLLKISATGAALIQLHPQDFSVQSCTLNSLCASGTGSFLDEQLGRLGLNYSVLNQLQQIESPPSIACRCAVFAKTDLIHRQQQGYTRQEMASGLCRSMAEGIAQNLLKSEKIQGPLILFGGVALNQELIRWLQKSLQTQIVTPPYPHLLGAWGAALKGLPRPTLLTPRSSKTFLGWNLETPSTFKGRSFDPQFNANPTLDSFGNELRIHSTFKCLNKQKTHVLGNLGIDIGSTSSKLILINSQKEVLLDLYRKTAGDPLLATQMLFAGFKQILPSHFQIHRVGITGSGRKLVGEAIGADLILNEITAHARGALFQDPSIEGIIEIGGQDAKWIQLKDGRVQKSKMNFVCAAGTGSFIEEQAHYLGFDVKNLGKQLLGISPPRSTERCTVFMNQDVQQLLQQGYSRQEAMAAVLVSVVKNYLQRVVGTTSLGSQKLFFQGATALNPALVSAFEKVLNRSLIVSPYCHVMGAYGAAIAASEAHEKNSRFRGLNFEITSLQLKRASCPHCHNHCEITSLKTPKKLTHWGHLCGKDPETPKMIQRQELECFQHRAKLWCQAPGTYQSKSFKKTIGIPKALLHYTQLPLWKYFFYQLGFQIHVSTQHTTRIPSGELCYPGKLALAHARSLLEDPKNDFVFLPHLASLEQNPHTTGTTTCPYVQAQGYAAKSFQDLPLQIQDKILTPYIDLRMSPKQIVQTLSDGLRPLQIPQHNIAKAWKAALQHQHNFEAKCMNLGEDTLEKSIQKGQKIIILLGRPYHLYDQDIHLNLPSKIASFGRTVIPFDLLSPRLENLPPKYKNFYWGVGQKILGVLERFKDHPQVDFVFLTSFGCGPDSFLLSYAEEILGPKPFLLLELDEHDSDVGYQTRLEAFFDSLATHQPQRPPIRSTALNPLHDLRQRTLWIPPLHAIGSEFFAAVFRSFGYPSQALPLETPERLELGRAHTRGSECLPASSTLGTLLKTLQEEQKSHPSKKHAYFMPTAEGPCRFGQYCILHRKVLDELHLMDVPILSPSSLNAYQGLETQIRYEIFKAMIIADILQKIGTRLRPYCPHPQEVDLEIENAKNKLIVAFEKKKNLPKALKDALKPLHRFLRFIEKSQEQFSKPLIGIVGEIYIRNNEFTNEQLIRSIESLGAEAWLTPTTEWILFTSSMTSYNQEHPSSPLSLEKIKIYLIHQWLLYWERQLYSVAHPWLKDRKEPKLDDIFQAAKPHLAINIGGEAQLTLGRAILFSKQNVSCIVNCSPFGCMPGVITSEIFKKISKEIQTPIFSLFYDGNGGQNKKLAIFLKTLWLKTLQEPIALADNSPSRLSEFTNPHEIKISQNTSHAQQTQRDPLSLTHSQSDFRVYSKEFNKKSQTSFSDKID